ncbi:NUDIX hydrolase [Paenibacillus sp. D51F]
MKMAATTIEADWGGHLVRLTWLPGAVPGAGQTVTSVHGVCVDNGHILLVKVSGRGWNLPGGHVEEGESPEEALLRECMEEGCVRCGSSSLLGLIRISHEANPLFDPQGKYPLVAYQAFYKTEVQERMPFISEHECTARVWAEPDQAACALDDHELARLIVKTAVQEK